MAITSESVREILKGLENGDCGAFFERVADDVDWIVMGTHSLAGHYRSKKNSPSLQRALAFWFSAHTISQAGVPAPMVAKSRMSRPRISALETSTPRWPKRARIRGIVTFSAGQKAKGSRSSA